MPQEPSTDPDDRPFAPPELDRGAGALRWVVLGVATVLLIVGAWRAYGWLVTDVERRRAVAVGAEAEGASPVSPAAPAVPAPSPAAPGRTIGPAQPSAPRVAEPAAPAVSGVAGVSKCVVNGQVTYTNAPCPEDAEEPPEEARAAGGTGATGLPAPALHPAALGVGNDPSARQSACGYLLAEVMRLDFEFQQPLPPPVLDHISSQLADLRARHEQGRCPPLPKPRAGASPTKVVDEKAG
ncbi:MAG: hypothetical protein Q4G71_05530 [Pseudomonadota bacterium]|nr:hypothetical protein [Pseudomonadota bacterium]